MQVNRGASSGDESAEPQSLASPNVSFATAFPCSKVFPAPVRSPSTCSKMEALKRTRAVAIRNVKRRAARQTDAVQSDIRFNTKEQLKNQNASKMMHVKNEKKHRREDWEVGPRLAPRRDVGSLAEKYATVDQSIMQPLDKSMRDRKGVRTWLAEGDRVVLLEGKDKGKIGRVDSVNEDSQTVRLRSMNLVCARLSPATITNH